MAGNRLAIGNQNRIGLVQRQNRFDIPEIEGSLEENVNLLWRGCGHRFRLEPGRRGYPTYSRGRRRCPAALGASGAPVVMGVTPRSVRVLLNAGTSLSSKLLYSTFAAASSFSMNCSMACEVS